MTTYETNHDCKHTTVSISKGCRKKLAMISNKLRNGGVNSNERTFRALVALAKKHPKDLRAIYGE